MYVPLYIERERERSRHRLPSTVEYHEVHPPGGVEFRASLTLGGGVTRVLKIYTLFKQCFWEGGGVKTQASLTSKGGV